jgi:hypothetical protein
MQVVVPGSAQVRLLWGLTNGLGVQINVLGAVKPGGTVISQTLANSLGAAIKAALTSSGLVVNLHTSTQLINVGVRDTSTANMPEFLDSGGPVAGTAPAADPLPHQTALVVTLRTARAGASYRGRVYLGGFTETENVGAATASPALAANSVAFVTAVQSAMSTAGLTLGVLSRPAPATETVLTINNADGTTTTHTKHTKARPGAITPVTLIQLRNSVFDNQRRRSAPGSVSTLFGPLISTDLETGEVVSRLPEPASASRSR